MFLLNLGGGCLEGERDCQDDASLVARTEKEEGAEGTKMLCLGVSLSGVTILSASTDA